MPARGSPGAIVSVRPPESALFRAEENTIVGNTVLYGATAGRAFFRGLAGERFAVRNSGAHAVVEGLGDHGCEYMTGGRVVVLGPHRAQLRRGHERGRRLCYDKDRRFEGRCNLELVELEPLTESDAEEVQEADLRARPADRLAGRAKRLASWDRASERFVKVIPRDYKRVITKHDGQEPAAVGA